MWIHQSGDLYECSVCGAIEHVKPTWRHCPVCGTLSTDKRDRIPKCYTVLLTTRKEER